MTEDQSSPRLPHAPWGDLPPTMRVLSIGAPGDKNDWLSDVFAHDSACRVTVHPAAGVVEGLARLRDETFDAVLIAHDARLDALAVLDAIRTGSSTDQPILVLGDASEAEFGSQCFESGADAYLCLSRTTTRMLLWHVARARERHRLIEENRSLQVNRRQQQRREKDEAQRVLHQQRELIQQMRRRRRERTDLDDEDAPRRLVNHYRELLQTYVVMGAGNLSREIYGLARMFSSAGLDALQATEVHLVVVNEMIRDLGNRSARHITNRADLLLVEVLLNLAEIRYDTDVQSDAEVAA